MWIWYLSLIISRLEDVNHGKLVLAKCGNDLFICLFVGITELPRVLAIISSLCNILKEVLDCYLSFEL